jgi:tungstate transport system ATP-binding protein
MADMNNNLIYQLTKIKKIINGKEIVRIEDLKVKEGELFVVVGPSGAGKSTLLRIMHLLEPITEGELSFMDSAVDWPVPISRRRVISMLFQRPEFISGNVSKNVNFPLRVRNIANHTYSKDILGQLNISSFADTIVNTLSGGEQQRVALARALVVKPKVLLLDEPTANLDPNNVEIIEEMIIELHGKGTTIVMVTHNVLQAKRLGTRVGMMSEGEMIEVAAVEEFFSDPRDTRTQAFLRNEYFS